MPISCHSVMASDRPQKSPLQGLSRASQRLENRLRKRVAQAIQDFSLIEAGDRILVALSGGKDSYTLFALLRQLQARAPIPFELCAVHLDQKQPGFPTAILAGYLAHENVPHAIIEQDTYRVVARVIPEGRNRCGLCSRLRRGALYEWARRHGYNKIALGHHQDDLLETFFLNLFHGGRLATMPPKLLSDDGRVVVIRPLAYCEEREIARYARAKTFPVIPCKVCGSQDRLERVAMKRMIEAWRREAPERIASIARALGQVSPSHLLDRSLWDFAGLIAQGPTDPEEHLETETGTPSFIREVESS